MSSYQNLVVNRRGAVAVVVLNRPDKFNALNIDLMHEIELAAYEFQGDVETRVVIFTGAGKHFSAGADLTDDARKSQRSMPMIAQRRLNALGPRMIRAIHEIDQITIAAINGGALGGGACIASACDFRVIAEGGFVSYPEIQLAMNLSWGALPLCVRLVGPARAKRMVILGEHESAPTLLNWGFVDEVVSPAERLVPRALEIAEQYAAKPPVQAQMIKRSIDMIAGSADAAVMHMDGDQFILSTTTKDHEEGVKSFLEKRKPDFKGQ